MRSVLYGGHTSENTSGCPYCKCKYGCPKCRGNGYNKGKINMPIHKRIASKINSSNPTARSKPSKGKYVSRCQDIKDESICNMSQILNANNLPTTGQVKLQTCGYYKPDKTCYPTEYPVNNTKIINVDPNIPGLLSSIISLN